jgi:hypothetical protein
MFTNDEKLWITTEFRKQEEIFLDSLHKDHTTKMINAATRLEGILTAVMKTSMGHAELYRLLLLAEPVGTLHASEPE